MDSNTTFNLLLTTYYAQYFLLGITALWSIRIFLKNERLSIGLRTILSLMIVYLVVQVIGHILQANQISNLFLLNILTPIEVWLTGPILTTAIFGKKNFRPILILGFLFTLFVLANSPWLIENNGSPTLNSTVLVSGHLLISILALWALIRITLQAKGNMLSFPETWFAVGILIYFLPTTGVMFAFDLSQPQEQIAIWIINNLASCLRSICFLAGLYWVEKSWR
ncbi:MAG TPA: hypothetical protein PKV71_14285 [Calditrichia bacterium]|nr:hypothetical protein [Calditrichota bacterium]HQU73021.1 hypothetical protein [Calditrichia bacterium]HQV33049.1 hypothetical protein [Calditrichia bacterium]